MPSSNAYTAQNTQTDVPHPTSTPFNETPKRGAEPAFSNRTPVALRKIISSFLSHIENTRLLLRSVDSLLTQLPLRIPVHILRHSHTEQPLRLDDAWNHIVLLRQLTEFGPVDELLLIRI
jgi:hypothetical protein